MNAKGHAEPGMRRIDDLAARNHAAAACAAGIMRVMNSESTDGKTVVMNIARGRRGGWRAMAAEGLSKMRMRRISDLRAQHHVA